MTTKMNLEALESNVHQWSSARGILEQSSYEKQMVKYEEEKREMMDAIGDQVVCLINANFLAAGMDYERTVIKHKIATLRGISEFIGVQFDECLGMAWDAIKDRKGLMIDGLFVKYENLDSEAQKLCDQNQ